MIDGVVQSVKCQLRTAVTRVVNNEKRVSRNRLSGKTYYDFLDKWGAEVAFTFTIVENSGANPSILGTPPSPASAVFSITGSFSGSAKSTRIEKLNYFFTVAELYMPDGVVCEESTRRYDSFLIQNDLKIVDLLYGRIGTDVLGITHPADPGQKNVLSHEITFQVITTVNVTPSLKLVPATINPSGNFLTAGRDRTHDLVITFGPLDQAHGNRSLIQIAEQTHHDLQLSSGVTTGFRTTFSP